MNHRYGTNRKTGVGFNHPRVLEGRLQYDYRRYYDLMRRIMQKKEQPRWFKKRSLVEALREYRE